MNINTSNVTVNTTTDMGALADQVFEQVFQQTGLYSFSIAGVPVEELNKIHVDFDYLRSVTILDLEILARVYRAVADMNRASFGVGTVSQGIFNPSRTWMRKAEDLVERLQEMFPEAMSTYSLSGN